MNQRRSQGERKGQLSGKGRGHEMNGNAMQRRRRGRKRRRRWRNGMQRNAEEPREMKVKRLKKKQESKNAGDIESVRASAQGTGEP